MPRPIPYREVKRRLETLGYREEAQKGSHVKFAKMIENGLRTVTVPKHREVAPGTLRSILRQAGIEPDVFFD